MHKFCMYRTVLVLSKFQNFHYHSFLMCTSLFNKYLIKQKKPPLRGHPYEHPIHLESPPVNVNLNTNVLISPPDERPPLLKGHISNHTWGGLARGTQLYLD